MQEVQGEVYDIVFQNEDNGYTVAKLKEKSNIITVVGCIPFITEGQNLKIRGEWIVHPQFGEQFKVESCEEIMPNSIIGLEKYLSSGIISGIGPVTAKKIVEKFGEKTLEVLDENIDRLKEIEGIGEKKIAVIKDSYSKQNEIRNIMIFLQTYGVTPNQCVKIHKRFGGEAISVVKNNPYILTEEINGIGFKTADKIARSLGIEANSPFRIQCGIKYVINQFCALGNTYMPLNKLVEEGVDILSVLAKEIEENVHAATVDGKLKIEEVNNNICVFDIPFYYCELSVTKKILTLAFNDYIKLDIDIDKEISEFEIENNITFATSQKEAIKGAIENGVEIITGGPGTGKTTIINCILNIFEKSNLRVMMGAPTGRAAKRMTESTGRESKTIHRLLEMGVAQGEGDLIFNNGEDKPLECDVLIIDEASMIDIMLMNSLLKALSVNTRIIIVGDVDQLPSVGPGNVLKDLIEAKCFKVVKLKEIFRQSSESMIIVNAHKINNGEMPMLNKKGKDFYFIKCDEGSQMVETLIDLINKRLPQFNKNWNKNQHIQILSPMRKGVTGVTNLNNVLQNILNPSQKEKHEIKFRELTFRVGDKVMQTKNNYILKWEGSQEIPGEGAGVFNGDVGYIEAIDEENETMTILFDDEKRVVYESIYFDELDLAYAMTVHKSQGSEFPVVIIPVQMGPQLLMNRNLLYTGITRAKQLVVLVGSLKALHFMINNNKSFERYSLLKWRITDIIESGVV